MFNVSKCVVNTGMSCEQVSHTNEMLEAGLPDTFTAVASACDVLHISCR